MSTGLRKRTVCQACGARYKGTPLEVAVHGGRGWRGHWEWYALPLCPVCRTARLDWLRAMTTTLADVQPAVSA